VVEIEYSKKVASLPEFQKDRAGLFFYSEKASAAAFVALSSFV